MLLKDLAHNGQECRNVKLTGRRRRGWVSILARDDGCTLIGGGRLLRQRGVVAIRVHVVDEARDWLSLARGRSPARGTRGNLGLVGTQGSARRGCGASGVAVILRGTGRESTDGPRTQGERPAPGTLAFFRGGVGLVCRRSAAVVWKSTSVGCWTELVILIGHWGGGQSIPSCSGVVRDGSLRS